MTTSFTLLTKQRKPTAANTAKQRQIRQKDKKTAWDFFPSRKIVLSMSNTAPSGRCQPSAVSRQRRIAPIRKFESAAFHRFFAFQPSAISAKALKSPDSDCIPIQSVCFAARNELSAKSAARRCHRQSFEPEALREARPGGPLINRIHSENNHVRHKHASATHDLLGL